MANEEVPDDLLEGMFQANASAGGVYITQHGIYDLLIKRSIYKKIKDVGRCFITEVRVLAAQKNVVEESGETIDEEPHPVGYEPAYVVNWDGEGAQSADGNAKALALGIFGLDEKKVGLETYKATFRELVSDAQPACGMVIRVTTYAKGVKASKDPVTKKFGRFIVLPRWQGLGAPGQGENTFDKIKARRADIEKYLASAAARDQAQADRNAVGSGGGAPALPSGPPALPPSLPTAAANPLTGWQLHPSNVPGDPDPFYWKGSENKRASDIVAGR